jgi:DNA-binding response OmpR family regulator
MGRANEVATMPPRLDGSRVLVVEDDFFIGLELAAILKDAGADVVGPLQTVQSALASAEDETLSAAILDIRLGDETVEPVARRLAEQAIPFLFYTGQSRTDPVQAMWPGCRIVAKPALPSSLLSAIAALTAKPRRQPAPQADHP